MKYIVTIVLALVLILGPTPAYAENHQICLATEIVQGEPICVDTGLSTDKTTIEVPVPPIPDIPDIDLPDIELPDIELPDVEVPNPTPGRPGGDGGSGGSGGDGTGADGGFIPGQKDGIGQGPQPENPQETAPRTKKTPSEEFLEPDGSIPDSEIFGLPWYFWLTLIVAIVGAGLMLYFGNRYNYQPRHRLK